MRPFFPYYGSKWNTARYYPPPTGSVIEPFAGSAGYSLFYNARKAVLIDADPIIVGVWSYLMGASESEILALPDLPEAGDTVDNYPNTPQEARWLIGFWLNAGSSQPKKTRTEYSTRTDRGQIGWGPRVKRRIVEQIGGLSEWSVQLGPYYKADNTEKETTWFVDPPYVDKGRFYRVKFTAFDTLAEWCRSRPGQVIVCENDGATWLPFEQLGSFKSSRGRSNEVVFWRPP